MPQERRRAVQRADRLAAGRTCADACVASGELRWRMKPQDAFIVGVRKPGNRPAVFTALAIGQFSAWMRCRKVPPGFSEVLEHAGLSGTLGWSIKKVE